MACIQKLILMVSQTCFAIGHYMLLQRCHLLPCIILAKVFPHVQVYKQVDTSLAAKGPLFSSFSMISGATIV